MSSLVCDGFLPDLQRVFQSCGPCHCFVDEKLTILSDYLGIDVSLLRSDYEDLRVAVTHAQHNKKLEGEIAIYGYVLTHFRHEQKDMKLLDAVQVWFVIQAQNGQLERDCSTKRRLEDRLKRHLTHQMLDQRLPKVFLKDQKALLKTDLY